MSRRPMPRQVAALTDQQGRAAEPWLSYLRGIEEQAVAIEGIDTRVTTVEAAILHVTRLSSDTASSSTTLADLGNLSFPAEANKTYKYKVFVGFDAAATTTGARFVMNGPSGGNVRQKSVVTLTGTTDVTNYTDGYLTPATASTTSLLTGNVCVLEGVATIGATAGDMQVQFASEVASAITALAAFSFIEWQDIT